jgi:hypothetical protein
MSFLEGMMGTRIKIKVEFEEYEVSNESVTAPSKEDDGSFVIELPAAFEGDIDMCEQAVLAANYPAIREAISQHLERISKKNRRAKQRADRPRRGRGYPQSGGGVPGRRGSGAL